MAVVVVELKRELGKFVEKLVVVALNVDGTKVDVVATVAVLENTNGVNEVEGT